MKSLKFSDELTFLPCKESKKDEIFLRFEKIIEIASNNNVLNYTYESKNNISDITFQFAFFEKYLQITFISEPDKFFWEKSLIICDGNQQYFVSSEIGVLRIKKIIRELCYYLNGNQIEIIYNSSVSNKQKKYWKIYKSADWKDIYYNQIYSIFSQLVSAIIKEKKNINIVDLGAGNADLAKLILDQYSNQINKYLLWDYLYDDLNFVNFLYDKLNNFKQVKIDYMDLNKLDMQENNVDLILACGILTHKVLKGNEVKAFFDVAYKMLNEKGYIICIGRSLAIFNSIDLKKAGFKVTNKFYPTIDLKINDNRFGLQVYIAYKI